MKDATRRDLLTGLAALAVAPVAATPALGDDVEVDGGKGTVINKGQLQIATLAPLAIRPVEPLCRPRAGVHVIGWRAGEAISPAVRAIMPKTGGKK